MERIKMMIASITQKDKELIRNNLLILITLLSGVLLGMSVTFMIMYGVDAVMVILLIAAAAWIIPFAKWNILWRGERYDH